jgi:hypothetical protein
MCHSLIGRHKGFGLYKVPIYKSYYLLTILILKFIFFFLLLLLLLEKTFYQDHPDNIPFTATDQ